MEFLHEEYPKEQLMQQIIGIGIVFAIAGITGFLLKIRSLNKKVKQLELKCEALSRGLTKHHLARKRFNLALLCIWEQACDSKKEYKILSPQYVIDTIDHAWNEAIKWEAGDGSSSLL